jgi:hypothetical protein
MADVLQIWIQALLTIGITTLAWKDQPVSRMANHIYTGVVVANSTILAWGNIMNIGVNKITAGNFIYVIAVLLGILTYARYSKANFWMYRYPIALVMGIGVGTAMRGLVGGSVLDQIRNSFFQLSVPGDAMQSVNNILSVVILLSALSYFLFTIKATRSETAMRFSALGRYAMMGAFGYSFANTIATRINQYAGRIAFLMIDWLQIAG